MEDYGQLVARLGELLLETGLRNWRQKGHASKGIILALAQVNMPMPLDRLRELVEEEQGVDRVILEDAFNDLASMGVVWRCLSCPADSICPAKPLTEHNCLVEGPRLLENLKRAGLRGLSQEEETQFLEVLRKVSHHGVDSVEEVVDVWPKVENGWTPEEEGERDFFGAPDGELQAWTCEMLQRATESIRIASEYGGWVAKQPFRDIIASKIRDGVEVTLVVNAPPAEGTNGRSEWEEWKRRHEEIGISSIQREWRDHERGGSSLNMTIVEDINGKEAIFFKRDRYGRRLLGPMYTNRPAKVAFCEEKFEEYIMMRKPQKRVIRMITSPGFLEFVGGAVGGVIGSLGGYALSLVGTVVGALLAYLGRKLLGALRVRWQ